MGDRMRKGERKEKKERGDASDRFYSKQKDHDGGKKPPDFGQTMIDPIRDPIHDSPLNSTTAPHGEIANPAA
jgi:hypothetical protein